MSARTAASSATVTYFVIVKADGTDTGTSHDTAEGAARDLAQMQSLGYWADYRVSTERTRTVHVGQAVRVDAFGKIRNGTVVNIGKTRAVVNYARNASGTRAQRAFPISQILPAL